MWPVLPPGPSASPLAQTWQWIRRPTHFLDDCRRRFGPTFTIKFVGGRSLVVVSEPEVIQGVFAGGDLYLAGAANKNFKRFAGPATLLALDGEQHRRHRRLLHPPFLGERMRAYGPLLVEEVRDEVARWRPNRPFRLLEPLRRITFEGLLRGMFGAEDVAARARLGAALHLLTVRTTALLVFLPALHVDLGPLSPWGRFLRARAAVDRLIYEAIAQARRDVAAKLPREDILAKLIEEGEARGDPLSDSELRDELITLVAAGHETTATTMAWCFSHLLADPVALARARAEVRTALGPRGDFRAERLEKLPFLDAIVQETMRVSPPFPAILRVLARDARVAGFDLPAGTYVAPSPWLAQRDPATWPDPARFRPERWLAPGMKAGPGEYLPFGGGPRICIGRSFAFFEMRLVLAGLLTLAPGLRLAGRPSRGIARQAIVVVPRDGTRVVLDEEGPWPWS